MTRDDRLAHEGLAVSAAFEATLRLREGLLEELDALREKINDATSRKFDPSRDLPTPTTVEEAVRQRDFWCQVAARHCTNEAYYRGLLEQVGESCGVLAKTDDEGVVQPEVLVAKVPEVVETLLRMARNVIDKVILDVEPLVDVTGRLVRVSSIDAVGSVVESGDSGPRRGRGSFDIYLRGGLVMVAQFDSYVDANTARARVVQLVESESYHSRRPPRETPR